MTRLNYTGRRRITRDRVSLRVVWETDPPVLDIRSVDLSGLTLQPDAAIVVEAYHQTNYLRLECGTVEAPLFGTHRLDGFSGVEGVLFRVKVVGQSGATAGRLLAVADRLPPTSDDEATARVPLLPFRGSDELGHRIWKLDLAGDRPEVVVSSRVGNWRQYAKQPAFVATVYPEVLRQVAGWVVDNADQLAEPDSYVALWGRYLAGLDADPRKVSPEERDDWADEVANSFASRNKLLSMVELADEAQ